MLKWKTGVILFKVWVREEGMIGVGMGGLTEQGAYHKKLCYKGGVGWDGGVGVGDAYYRGSLIAGGRLIEEIRYAGLQITASDR